MGMQRSPHALTADSWRQIGVALQSYRSSVDLYRGVLELKAARERRLPRERTPREHVVPNGMALARLRRQRGLEAALGSLTPRERDVAMLMGLGYTNQQIAAELVVTRGTAANHVAHILGKLGLVNRTQVAAYLARAGMPAAS